MSESLASIAGELLGDSLWEALAAALALAYLLLAVRRSLWCWLCAFVSTSIYLVLMARAGLVMQTLLQVFYLAMAVYGYIEWRRGRVEGELAIVHWSWPQHVAAGAVVLSLSFINAWALGHVQGAQAPLLDAFVAWGSVITTWMVARRVIENWLYWIVVDSMAAYLYFEQGLKATALLFVAYVGIVIHGYFTWLKQQRKQRAEYLAPAGASGESH